MRIRKIEIARWRNFEDIAIDLSDDQSLICIVGANGTGKSHLLELISAAAHHLGLSAGIQIPRGNPFDDLDHQFGVVVHLPEGVSPTLDPPFNVPGQYEAWDRTLKVESKHAEGSRDLQIYAGGIVDSAQQKQFAQEVIARLRKSQGVHHLSLDADRAYPRRSLQTHEMAQAFETKWETTEFTKGRSFHPTDTLYGEWIKYCLAKENRAANLFYQEARRANETGVEAPKFVDTFGSYRSSLREVMPHLLFAGADQERRALLFDTSGMELRFDQLSGGEREIAFLVGQIDRFGLKHGLFLLDEPELHLNPDLVRIWVAHLAKTVETGQVWLATHSLEAVEAAGQNSTVLLERNQDTRRVKSAGFLENRPVYSALSRAVGTPAFSINELRFVFIEGKEAIGERERYRRICDLMEDTRFMECGSCNEVARRVSDIRKLATTAQQDIRVAGIVDRDWRSTAQSEEFAKKHDVFVLPVHEVENLFLDPKTLKNLAQQNGYDDFDYTVSLQSACDHRAGGWIIQAVCSSQSLDVGSEGRAVAHSMSWAQIEGDVESAMNQIAEASGAVDDEKTKLAQKLMLYARMYKRKRQEPDLWKICEGKEVLKKICGEIGFADTRSLEGAASKSWSESEANVPDEVKKLRQYVLSV